MVKVSVLYPNAKGSRFDFRYYAEKHMPLSIDLLSKHPGWRGVSVERGVSGGAPGTEPTYVAMCHFLFDSAESFAEAFQPHAATLMGDVPNYTDVSAVLQISEVVTSR